MTIFFVALTYLVLSIIAFAKLLQTFFQQDEWIIFGNYLYWDKAGLNWFDRLLVFQQYTHIVPISNFLSYLQYALFGLSFPSYAVVSIVIHITNALLVYYLTTLFVKNKYVGFLVGLFFLTNSITQQTITWVATTTGTTGSTLVMLLSIIFFMRFLRRGEKIFDVLLSALFLGISLLMKETSIFCFVFFPLLWFLYGRKKNILKGIRIFSPFAVLGMSYVLFRLYFLLFGYHPTFAPEELSQPNILVYLFRIMTFPLKFIAQSFIPETYIIAIGKVIVLLGYPHFVQGGTPDPYIVETIASDIVSYLIAFGILGLSVFLCTTKTIREIEISKLVIASVLFISLSSLPFIFIPGKGGYLSLIDGRHLYLTSIFSSIFLSGLLFSLYKTISNKRVITLLIIIGIVGYIGMNILQIRKALNTQMGLAFTRKSILQKITASYPQLPQSIIFYIESDTPYYGLAYGDNILPFQSGFGQTLLVWYNQRGENFPACFFKDQFLYVLQSEGYRDCGGRGFGYFRKMDSLKNAVETNKVESDEIVAFSYISSENSLKNITQKIREQLLQ